MYELTVLAGFVLLAHFVASYIQLFIVYIIDYSNATQATFQIWIVLEHDPDLEQMIQIRLLI